MQRFISEDPIRLNGSDLNYYAYVQNNSINWVDSYGLKGGGVLIPIRDFLKDNITEKGLVEVGFEELGKALAIPLAVADILTHDFRHPVDAGTPDEDSMVPRKSSDCPGLKLPPPRELPPWWELPPGAWTPRDPELRNLPRRQ